MVAVAEVDVAVEETAVKKLHAKFEVAIKSVGLANARQV
jgi:hypothetical protein